MAADAVTPGKLFLEGFDNQVATLKVDVFGARSVGLQLVVSPAVAASLRRPFCGIRRRPVRAIELGTPGHHPLGARLRCGGRGSLDGRSTEQTLQKRENKKERGKGEEPAKVRIAKVAPRRR